MGEGWRLEAVGRGESSFPKERFFAPHLTPHARPGWHLYPPSVYGTCKGVYRGTR